MSQIDEFKKSIQDAKVIKYDNFESLIRETYNTKIVLYELLGITTNNSFITIKTRKKPETIRLEDSPYTIDENEFDLRKLVYDLCVKGGLEWDTNYLVLMSW